VTVFHNVDFFPRTDPTLMSKFSETTHRERD